MLTLADNSRHMAHLEWKFNEAMKKVLRVQASLHIIHLATKKFHSPVEGDGHQVEDRRGADQDIHGYPEVAEDDAEMPSADEGRPGRQRRHDDPHLEETVPGGGGANER